MCGIAGFYQSLFDYLTEEDHYRQILEDMEKVQKHRGPGLAAPVLHEAVMSQI